MRHYLYKVVSHFPAPAAGNDMGSWFRYYKWERDEEVFVPLLDATRLLFLTAEPGDTLWFALDDAVIGCAPITQLMDEAAQRKVEVWYDASKKMLTLAPITGRQVEMLLTGPIPEEVGSQWALQLTPKV